MIRLLDDGRRDICRRVPLCPSVDLDLNLTIPTVKNEGVCAGRQGTPRSNSDDSDYALTRCHRLSSALLSLTGIELPDIAPSLNDPMSTDFQQRRRDLEDILGKYHVSS